MKAAMVAESAKLHGGGEEDGVIVGLGLLADNVIELFLTVSEDSSVEFHLLWCKRNIDLGRFVRWKLQVGLASAEANGSEENPKISKTGVRVFP